MKKVFLAIGLMACMGSCYNDKFDKLYVPKIDTTVVNTCDTSGTISYASVILPIFAANCSTNNSSCHSPAGTSGVDLTTWNAYIRGNALNGKLVKDINFAAAGSNNMPKGGAQMSDCNINKVTRWVNQGALNN